ncbi:hypothetical protein [Anaerolentibacter hominis]|uniref:hypothetical protein n=1 Tax=Anaerolentibacter hominis TaxID=3079009 RepID=UPI0031B82698
MKKSMLYTGIGYTLAGLLFIILAVATETRLDALLWGFGGAGIGPGLMMIWKYLYWTRPGKREEYESRLKTERIDLRDERKIMLRDKSGRITYVIMTGVYCLLILAASIVNVLGYLRPFSTYLVYILTFLLLFQFLCGLFVFHKLDSKL